MSALSNYTLPLDNDTSDEIVYQLAASTSQHQQQLSKAPITELINWKDVPDKYLLIVANFLVGRINDSSVIDQLNGPILKSSVNSTYWIFLIQYAALSLLGIVMNIAIIGYIMYHRFYKDVTNAFIVNLALCHFIQCAVVLPITLMVMIIQNWIFGQFLCFFLPMLQDIPLHVALISHILIAWDRMRWLRDPMRGRFPAFVCCCATWLTGMVIALPYPIYMMYVEIGDFVPSLSGIGLCVVNLMDDMHEYMRGLFVIMYCGPTVFMAYLYVKTSQELRPPEGPLAVMMFEHRAGVRNRQKRNSSTSSGDRSFSGTAGGGGMAGNGTSTTSGIGTITTHTTTSSKSVAKSLTRSYDLYNAELDVNREKRKQRNFGSMAAAQVLCLCPLMVLRFARLSMEETYENQKHIDFTYLMFVWIAFLPTVIFPCIYASQILPRAEQERLRGYFRLSSKRMKLSRSVGAGIATETHAYGNNKHVTRKSSSDKDDSTLNGCTMPTSIIANGGDGDESSTLPLHGMSAKVGRHDPKATAGKYHQRPMGKSLGNGKHYTHTPSQHGSGRNGNSNSLKLNDIKINVISDEQSKGSGDTPSRVPHRTSARKASGGSCSNNGSIASGYPHAQRKLTLDSLDMSASNITASTYCIGNGNGNSYMDDGGTSNFGDGEESSIAGGGSSHAATYCGGSDKKWSSGRHNDSVSDCDTLSRLDSSSTLARDLEMIDLLERERSMNMHDLHERDRHGGDFVRSVAGERRRLPDLEKIYQLSPKISGKHDMYNFEGSTTSTSVSTLNGQDTHTLSTSVPTDYDPLQSTSSGGRSDAYSAASTLPEEQLKRNSYGHEKSSSTHQEEDEEVPSDFYDNYIPGGKEPLPNAGITTTNAPPVYQYQYSRRLSRNSAHHSQNSATHHHRNSKRDSFNSLNGTDLIAGAFGELDPTQPLTKMSVIESRMRRSSGRTSSFSSSARSSMKSRDYNHGSSSHSAHPELDFRENIFAEL